MKLMLLMSTPHVTPFVGTPPSLTPPIPNVHPSPNPHPSPFPPPQNPNPLPSSTNAPSTCYPYMGLSCKYDTVLLYLLQGICQKKIFGTSTVVKFINNLSY